jgi:hypothetical protein
MIFVEYLDILWKKIMDKAIAKEIKKLKQKEMEENKTSKTIDCLVLKKEVTLYVTTRDATIEFVAI